MLIILALAQAATTTVDPLSFFINYGVAGVVLGLFITGQVKSKSEVTALNVLLAESKEVIKAKDLALEALTNQLVSIVPQLAKVGDVVAALPQNTDTRLTQAMAELTSRLDHIDQGR